MERVINVMNTFITQNIGIHVTGMYVVMAIERAIAAARRRRRVHRHRAPPVTAEQVAASSCGPGTADCRFVNANRHRPSTFFIFRLRPAKLEFIYFSLLFTNFDH